MRYLATVLWDVISFHTGHVGRVANCSNYLHALQQEERDLRDRPVDLLGNEIMLNEHNQNNV